MFECSDAQKNECVKDKYGCGIIWRHADSSLKELLTGNVPECAKLHIEREQQWRTETDNTIPDWVAQIGPRKPRPWDDSPEQ